MSTPNPEQGYVIVDTRVQDPWVVGEVRESACPLWVYLPSAIDAISDGRSGITREHHRFYKVCIRGFITGRSPFWKATNKIEVMQELTIDEFRKLCEGNTVRVCSDGDTITIHAHVLENGRLFAHYTETSHGRVYETWSTLDGFRHGVWVTYYDTGAVWHQLVYDQGKLLRMEDYAADGALLCSL